MIVAHPGASLPPAPAPGDLAALLYTSGTTGDPKGVMLTHGNLASNCSSLITLNIFQAKDNILSILPLHHTYPAMGCVIFPLSVGATVTQLNSLKGPDILACMQETGVTILVGVPQLFAALRRAVFDEIGKKPALVRVLVKLLLGLNGELRSVAGINIGKKLFKKVHEKFGARFSFFASGGARLEPDVYTDMSNLGFILIEGYGLTETSPVCMFNPLGKQKAGSIGIPVPGVQARIANPDQNGMGEIAVKGPNVMAGYYNKPAETAEVIRDGWFYTGDLGYRDRAGYYFITGRSKEMIVLSTGKKIFPEELEKFYKQIPSIKEICLLQGERGLEAAVVPDFDHLRRMNISNSREAVTDAIESLAKDLPPYKRIMGLKVFKDPLPVTRLGKLRRAMVKDLYLQSGEQAEKPVQEIDRSLLSSEVGRKVLSCVEPFSPKKAVAPDDNLELDLGLDSLARVEFVVNLEHSFGIGLTDSFGSEVLTIRDVVLKIQELLDTGLARKGERVKMSWSEVLGQEPSEEVRRSLMLDAGWLRTIGKYAIKIFFTVLYMLYGRMSAKGVENLPAKGPYMIAPNHVSYADAPLVWAAMPRGPGSQTFFLGHARYFGGPVTSRIAKMIQVIPVDMETKLTSALQLSAHVLRQGKILCVFPEGTRSHDGKIKEFKKGVGIIAKELNVPIIPTAIHGTFEMLPPDKTFPRPAKVGVSFGKPIYPGNMDYDEIVKKLREEVLKLLAERREA
jgi:long-chain acyl-CoA synthetase